jgi:uncharacterized membrane protein
MGHAGHAHGRPIGDDDDEVPVAAPGVARLLWWTIGGLLALTVVAMVLMWPSTTRFGADTIDLVTPTVHARVQAVEFAGCSYDPSLPCRVVTASVTEGEHAGEVFTIDQGIDGVGKQPDPGDDFLASAIDAGDGTVAYDFYDYERSSSLVWLSVIFIAAVVVLGRWRGAGAIAGLVASVLVIVLFLIPAILQGENAIAVALVSAVFIAVVALFLAHGINVATAVALLSSFASMALTVALAALFVRVGNLTGFADEDTQFLSALAVPIDPRGLLLAGVLIGSLGVLDDVTVTQVSVAWELRRLHPDADWYWVYQRAIRIGRDHISSTVNTLFLAYAGASLSLLLVFAQTGRSLASVVTSEVVAVEVVRALVGSIGLIASVPIATWLAATILRSRNQDPPPPRRYPKPAGRRPAVDHID